MIKYGEKYHSIEDLLADEEFRKWVLQKDENLDYFWLNWLKSYPDKIPLAMKAKEIILAFKFPNNSPGEFDEEEVLTKVLQEKYSHSYQPNTTIVHHRHQKALPYKKRKRWLNIAAVLTILAGGLTFIIYENQKVPQVEQVQAVQWVVKENPRSHRSSFNLPDGTRIVLNINSSIRYPEKFDGDQRLVEIHGEAYFEVSENKEKPFIVKSKHLVTTALGTSFNVRALDSEKEEEIALISGSVKVEYKSDTTNAIDFLEPGQRLLLNRDNELLKKSGFTPEAVIGWKDGVLLFENDDYKTVVKKIERWYGVHISLLNRPAINWEINGRFVNKSLHGLLTSLNYMHGVEFKIYENDIVELKF